jgi:hypothetical protein
MANLSAIAQEVTIDMRYNVLRSEPSMDYLNWSMGNKRVNDSYDALTGASAARSTREFDAVRYDSMATKRYTIPVAIRHLLLFPVSSRRYTDNFNLTVYEEGGRLIIFFIVYGTAYKIQTDNQKEIDIDSACFFAKDVTVANTLSSPIRQQYVKSGADPAKITSIDWSKISFTPDTAVFNASRKYSGILRSGYNNSVLTVNGVLTPLPL